MRRLLLLTILTFWGSVGESQDTWEQMSNPTWKCQQQKYFKLDEKCNLLTSDDDSNWVTSKDGKWKDDEGRWYRITKEKLYVSTNGKKWIPSESGIWQASEGYTYKVKGQCRVWRMKNANIDRAQLEKEKQKYKAILQEQLMLTERRIDRLKGDTKSDLGDNRAQLENEREKLKIKLSKLDGQLKDTWAAFKSEVDELVRNNSQK